jgi:hypothetical protein
MRARHFSAPPPAVEPDAVPAEHRPNRAARRGKREGAVQAPTHGHGAAPHARGAQGRRINPVRRTG